LGGSRTDGPQKIGFEWWLGSIGKTSRSLRGRGGRDEEFKKHKGREGAGRNDPCLLQGGRDLGTTGKNNPNTNPPQKGGALGGREQTRQYVRAQGEEEYKGPCPAVPKGGGRQ